MAHRVHRQRGFSLIELTIVIAIVGFLLGALLVPLATQHEARQVRDQQRMLSDIRDSLVGFAVANGRLPCPDIPPPPPGTPDGIEDPPGGGPPCSGFDGVLPWQTLGLPATDVWGRLYRYRVDARFTYPTAPGTPPIPLANAPMNLNDRGTLSISDRDEAKNPVTLATEAVAVVVSHGPNGRGGTDINGKALAAPTAGTDEDENADSDNAFIARVRSADAAPCSDTAGVGPLCAFDDQLVWVPYALLFLRLVEAGQLP